MAETSRSFRAFAAMMRGANKLSTWDVDARMLKAARVACMAVPNLGPFFGWHSAFALSRWAPTGVAGPRPAYSTSASSSTPPWRYEKTSYGGRDCLEFTPTAGPTRPGVIIYVHGGAYVIGSAAMTKSLASVMCHLSGMRVISIDYSLAPEHPLPQATHDVVGAFRAIAARVPRSEPISLVGDSAGGGLVLLTTQALLARRKVNAAVATPTCAVAISPWADLTCSAPSYLANQERDLVLGAQPYPESFDAVSHMAVGNLDAECQPTGAGNDRADPLFSPLFGSFDGFPPTLLMVGSEEMLLDDTTRLHTACAAAGVDVAVDVAPGMCHSYPMFTPLFPEADRAVRRITDYIVEKSGGVRDEAAGTPRASAA